MRIAIADDDATFANFILSICQAEGYTCAAFGDGQAIITQLQRETYDLVILDCRMPRVDGEEVLKWINHNLTVPPGIIMLTSQNDKAAVARALKNGADDYIVKPETAPIILARIAAVLRRTASKPSPAHILKFGGYSFDRVDSNATFDTETVRLTAKEFALAVVFFQNLNRPLSRNYLLDTVWHSIADLPTRTLDVHVSHIRAKLKLAADRGFRLHTIIGYGYRLETNAEPG